MSSILTMHKPLQPTKQHYKFRNLIFLIYFPNKSNRLYTVDSNFSIKFSMMKLEK